MNEPVPPAALASEMRRQADVFRKRGNRIHDLAEAAWDASRKIAFHGPAADRFRARAKKERLEAGRLRVSLVELAKYLDKRAGDIERGA